MTLHQKKEGFYEQPLLKEIKYHSILEFIKVSKNINNYFEKCSNKLFIAGENSARKKGGGFFSKKPKTNNKDLLKNDEFVINFPNTFKKTEFCMKSLNYISGQYKKFHQELENHLGTSNIDDIYCKVNDENLNFIKANIEGIINLLYKNIVVEKIFNDEFLFNIYLINKHCGNDIKQGYVDDKCENEQQTYLPVQCESVNVNKNVNTNAPKQANAVGKNPTSDTKMMQIISRLPMSLKEFKKTLEKNKIPNIQLNEVIETLDNNNTGINLVLKLNQVIDNIEDFKMKIKKQLNLNELIQQVKNQQHTRFNHNSSFAGGSRKNTKKTVRKSKKTKKTKKRIRHTKSSK